MNRALIFFISLTAAHSARALPLAATAPAAECTVLLGGEDDPPSLSDEQIYLSALLKAPKNLKEYIAQLEEEFRRGPPETAAAEVLQVLRENLVAFMDPAAGVRADWNLGQAMVYPELTAKINRRVEAIPSSFGREEMLDLDGRAYVQLKTYDAAHGRFLNRIYPVVRLSADGHPVLLIHPDNHLLIPTVQEIRRPDEYLAADVSVTEVTRGKPVKVKLYRGQKHGGLFNQFIVARGHRAAFAAIMRHQPLYVELTGLSKYYPFITTWKTMLLTRP